MPKSYLEQVKERRAELKASGPFWVRVKQRTEQLKSWPGYDKRQYARRFSGLLQASLFILFLGPAYLAEKFLGVSVLTACLVDVVAATCIPSVATEIIVRRKFADKKTSNKSGKN